MNRKYTLSLIAATVLVFTPTIASAQDNLQHDRVYDGSDAVGGNVITTEQPLDNVQTEDELNDPWFKFCLRTSKPEDLDNCIKGVPPQDTQIPLSNPNESIYLGQ